MTSGVIIFMGHLCDGDCAILVAEGEPLESNHFGVLVNRLDVSGDRNLLVGLNEILLLKSLLLEELLDTSVGDVLDHLLRERRGLLGRDGLDDLTGLLCLLWSDPTLGGVGLDVILAVNVGRIDADLLESGLDSLLVHLVLCLLDSELALLLNHLSRAVGRRDSPARQILAEFHPAGPAHHGLDRIRRIRAATLQKPFVFHDAKLYKIRNMDRKNSAGFSG